MAIIYYPKDKIIFKRDTNDAEYEQLYLDTPPNTIFYFGNDLSIFSASYFEITTSWAISASYALNGGSGGSGSSPTASYALFAETADFAFESAYSVSASYAPTNGSTVITESSTTRSLTPSDENKWIRFTAASCSVILTTGSWSSNAELFLESAGTGYITVYSSSGIILHSSTTFQSNTQYSVMGLKRVDTNTWILVGDRLVL